MSPACYNWVGMTPFMTPTTMPQAPTTLVATESSGDVILTWDDPTEGDIRYFNVYRGTVSGSLTLYDTYELYGEEWRTTVPTRWVDYGPATNTYYYEVTFVNYDGTEGPPATEVSAVVP